MLDHCNKRDFTAQEEIQKIISGELIIENALVVCLNKIRVRIVQEVCLFLYSKI